MDDVYEVHIDREAHDVKRLAIYRMADHGQLALVASQVFGPFSTALEVSQWVWRQLTLDLGVQAF